MQTYYYITSPNSNWQHVEYGPYTSIVELKSKALELANQCSDLDAAIRLSCLNAVASYKRIRQNKNIRNDWAIGCNRLDQSKDEEVKAAIQSTIKEYDNEY